MNILTLTIQITASMIRNGCHLPELCPIAEGIAKAMYNRGVTGFRMRVAARCIEIYTFGHRPWLVCENVQDCAGWITRYDLKDCKAGPTEFTLRFVQP